MVSSKALLVAIATLSVIAGPGLAAASGRGTVPPLFQFVAVDTPDTPAVTAAEAAVEQARAALRQAMASGTGVSQARKTLQKALKDLDAARVASGEPPTGEATEMNADEPPADATPPPPETLPTETPGDAAPADGAPPDAAPADLPHRPIDGCCLARPDSIFRLNRGVTRFDHAGQSPVTTAATPSRPGFKSSRGSMQDLAEEQLGPLVLRVGEELLRRVLLDDLALRP